MGHTRIQVNLAAQSTQWSTETQPQENSQTKIQGSLFGRLVTAVKNLSMYIISDPAIRTSASGLAIGLTIGTAAQIISGANNSEFHHEGRTVSPAYNNTLS